MIKVMHVLNTGTYSGAENVVITLINATKNSVDSTYVSLDGTIKEYLTKNDIKFIPVSKLDVSEIKQVIDIVKPDIIHAHDFTAGIICSLSTNRIPIINHLHNNPPWLKHMGINSIAYGLCCYKFKRILTVSNSVMDEFIFGRKNASKTTVVGNPIDIDRVRKLAGDSEYKQYDIAFLGRLTTQKNPALFLKIINSIKDSLGNVTAVMIGDGELKAEIEEYLDKNNLKENVKLVGFQINPFEYLNQSRVLLMPSSWEGFGLAAVEALSLGIPVVCSSVGGLPLLVNESCGRCCNTENEYIQELLALLTDNSFYSQKSKEARTKAESLSNIESYTNMILSQYNELINANNNGKVDKTVL